MPGGTVVTTLGKDDVRRNTNLVLIEYTVDINREGRNRGAQTSALFRRGGRGAAFRPSCRTASHRAATALAADPPLRGRARRTPPLSHHPQRRTRPRRRGTARTRP